MLNERMTTPESYKGDILDQAIKDMEKEKFLSEDFIVQLIFSGFFATFESISAVMALAFMLLSEHPSVLEEMIVSCPSFEHQFIINCLSTHFFSYTYMTYI